MCSRTSSTTSSSLTATKSTSAKNDDKEIDFIAERDHSKIYLQVAAHISDKSAADREFSALRDIQDNSPKYVLTLDQTFLHSEDSIESKYLPDFILNEL